MVMKTQKETLKDGDLESVWSHLLFGVQFINGKWDATTIFFRVEDDTFV